jgi:polysaccharide export outer membrane protein
MRRILTLAIIALALGSCVPTKRLTYLQEIKGSPNDTLVVAARKVQPPYRFQVNDIININIRIPADPELELLFSTQGGQQQQQAGGGAGGQLFFNGYSVDIHGDIRVPKLGTIKAVGLTADELRESIATELNKFIRNERDYFIQVKMDGLLYTLTGEVNGPGQNKVYQNQLNIVEAISIGGGIPITGDLTEVRIIRQTPTGIRKLTFDLTDISILSSPDILIQQNDIIVVNPLPQKSLGLGTTGFGTFTTIIGIGTGILGLILILNTTSN